MYKNNVTMSINVYIYIYIYIKNKTSPRVIFRFLPDIRRRNITKSVKIINLKTN